MQVMALKHDRGLHCTRIIAQGVWAVKLVGGFLKKSHKGPRLTVGTPFLNVLLLRLL